jgi:hypothetical protein
MKMMDRVGPAPSPNRRRRIVRLVIGAAVVLVLADAFVPPPAHEVHSLDADAVRVAAFDSSAMVQWLPGQPSQTLADVNCFTRSLQINTRCDENWLSDYFPGLTQNPQTLYLVWPHCVWFENGSRFNSQGFNLDYFSSSRTLIIHCFAAKPWLFVNLSGHGMAPSPLFTLLAVPTASIGAGSITIREDDRLEHLIGDQSTEFQVATANIS